MLDFITNSLYVATIVLRIISMNIVQVEMKLNRESHLILILIYINCIEIYFAKT